MNSKIQRVGELENDLNSQTQKIGELENELKSKVEEVKTSKAEKQDLNTQLIRNTDELTKKIIELKSLNDTLSSALPIALENLYVLSKENDKQFVFTPFLI